MKMGLKAEGLNELAARLRYAATKVPDNARKVMHREADVIVKEAVLNAPVDDAQLEKSIHKEIAYEARGRLTIAIVAGGTVDGVDVSRYAVVIHENYEAMKPGPNTLAKRRANPGRRIGSKFIQRAVQARRRKLKAGVIKGAMEALPGKRFGDGGGDE